MNKDQLRDLIKRVLKNFGSSSYWYGEETGDYDMDIVHDEWFFKAAVTEIIQGLEKEMVVNE